MKDAKEDIENLKNSLLGIKMLGNQHGDRNLDKNDNLSNEMLNNLNKQSMEHADWLKKTAKEMADMAARIKSL